MDESTFVKQRRNLVLVSVVLLVCVVKNVPIQQINVLGNVFPFRQPVQAWAYVWPLWVYWLYRYLGAYYQQGKIGYDDYCRQRLNEVLGKVAARKIMEEERPITKTPAATAPGVELSAIVTARVEKPNTTPKQYDYLVSLQAFNPATGSQGSIGGQESVAFSSREITCAKWKTRAILLFKTTAYSEYVFPFWFAMAPPVCGLLIYYDLWPFEGAGYHPVWI